jgi:hypothetical protein
VTRPETVLPAFRVTIATGQPATTTTPAQGKNPWRSGHEGSDLPINASGTKLGAADNVYLVTP